MRHLLTLLFSIILFCFNTAVAQNIPPEGFKALFNGKDLEGWFGHGTKDPRTLWKMSPQELKEHQEKIDYCLSLLILCFQMKKKLT